MSQAFWDFLLGNDWNLGVMNLSFLIGPKSNIQLRRSWVKVAQIMEEHERRMEYDDNSEALLCRPNRSG